MKILSWNLLRLTGATVTDIAALVEREDPDLVLLQEATKETETLPELVGGYFQRLPLPARIYGLGVWSREALPPTKVLALPTSSLPGRVPPRLSQLIEADGISFANVHLSHGQVLNRRQLYRISQTLQGPAAIIGDYNAFGPIMLPDFRDVGPREPTLRASDVLPFRLDRCMVRDLRCGEVGVLDRGRSDHHPIRLHLHLAEAAASSTAPRSRWRSMPDFPFIKAARAEAR